MTTAIEQHSITSHEAVRAVREIIRRGLLTFQALPDPQAAFRYTGASWAGQWKGDLYADEVTRVRYVPSAHEIDQAELILPWLKWLGDTRGRREVRRLIAWCHGVSTTDLGRREGVSSKTIMSRINRAVSAIIEQFFGLMCTVEVVDEPYKNTDFAVTWKNFEDWRQEGPPKIMTVYVHTYGLMRNGKRWNDGRNKVDRMKVRARKR